MFTTIDMHAEAWSERYIERQAANNVAPYESEFPTHDPFDLDLERAFDLSQLGITHTERLACFRELLSICQCAETPLLLPSDTPDSKELFRWESETARLDCLTDPFLQVVALQDDIFVPPIGAFFSVTTVLIDLKDTTTAARVDTFLFSILTSGIDRRGHDVGPTSILAMVPSTWCIDALALAVVGGRTASEFDVELTDSACAVSCHSWQSFVYGDCGLPELHTLLCVLERHCGLMLEGKAFVDLGHGTGELLLAAALLRDWGSVRGVEACAQRFGESQRLLARWHAQVITCPSTHLTTPCLMPSACIAPARILT